MNGSFGMLKLKYSCKWQNLRCKVDRWEEAVVNKHVRVSQKYTNLIQSSSSLSMTSPLGRLNRTGLLTIVAGPVMNWNVQPIMDKLKIYISINEDNQLRRLQERLSLTCNLNS